MLRKRNLQQQQSVVCVVCEHQNDGLHFGKPTCRACAAFFRRTISQKLQYICQGNGNCEIDKGARNACRSCRFQKCVAQGMLPSSVQNSSEMTPPALLPPLTAPAPPQYKHLDRMREGLHQLWSLLKAAQAMTVHHKEVEDFFFFSPITVITAAGGKQRPQSRFESSKQICKVAYPFMFDAMERFCWPFNELPMEDKHKIFNNYKPLYCNTLRAYVTSKEFGPGDNRLIMPDGGYVQLDQLHLFFKDSKLITGKPEQVARIFHNAIQFLLTNVVGHMRNIGIQEMESVAMVAMFIWADSAELTAKTQHLAQQVRNEIIVELHHYYRSLRLAPEEITLKTANLFLLIPKLETVVKMMIEDASISDLFNLVAVEESYKGHMVV